MTIKYKNQFHQCKQHDIFSEYITTSNDQENQFLALFDHFWRLKQAFITLVWQNLGHFWLMSSHKFEETLSTFHQNSDNFEKVRDNLKTILASPTFYAKIAKTFKKRVYLKNIFQKYIRKIK